MARMWRRRIVKQAANINWTAKVEMDCMLQIPLTLVFLSCSPQSPGLPSLSLSPLSLSLSLYVFISTSLSLPLYIPISLSLFSICPIFSRLQSFSLAFDLFHFQMRQFQIIRLRQSSITDFTTHFYTRRIACIACSMLIHVHTHNLHVITITILLNHGNRITSFT